MPTTSHRDHPTARLGESDRVLHFLLRMPRTARHLLVLYQRRRDFGATGRWGTWWGSDVHTLKLS